MEKKGEEIFVIIFHVVYETNERKYIKIMVRAEWLVGVFFWHTMSTHSLLNFCL